LDADHFGSMGSLLRRAGSRPGGRGTFFCFAKRKYPKKRRAGCAVPPLRCGHAALLGPSGVGLNSPAAQTTPALIRPSLRYSPTHDGGRRERIRGHSRRLLPWFCSYINHLPEEMGVKAGSPEGQSNPACRRQGRAEQRRGVGIRNSHVRRPRSGQVCEFPPRSEQRKEARRAPVFGSPFLCSLSFGEAKESEAPAGAKPGTSIKTMHKRKTR
jgi:hypothetical protein